MGEREQHTRGWGEDAKTAYDVNAQLRVLSDAQLLVGWVQQVFDDFVVDFQVSVDRGRGVRGVKRGEGGRYKFHDVRHKHEKLFAVAAFLFQRRQLREHVFVEAWNDARVV